MKQKKNIVLAGLLITILFSVSFSNKYAFNPTNDFSWLGRYVIFDETVNLNTWEDVPGFKKDSLGVITYNGNYNPCSISEYTLKIFNEYQKTKDTVYKNTFLRQVKWLTDSANFTIINGNMLGHPYNYSFHDLKAPWYSGLSETEFISVLIRYYSITKDSTVIPLIISSRNFILEKEENGGLLSKTPEGNLWIEEYQPSKQERHVITGFYVTLISLNEYCQMFPDDKEAKEVFKLGLESIKKSMQFYDDGNMYIAYNRGDGRHCSNWYTKMLTLATRELYYLSKDKFFLNQYMLWSTYTYNRKVGRAAGTCIVEDYNFSELLYKDSTGWYKFPVEKLDFTAKEAVALPVFFHFTVDFNSTEKSSTLKFKMEDVKDYLIYYRQASSIELLNKEKWTQDKMFAENNFKLQTEGKPYTRFLFIYKRKNMNAKIGNITFK